MGEEEEPDVQGASGGATAPQQHSRAGRGRCPLLWRPSFLEHSMYSFSQRRDACANEWVPIHLVFCGSERLRTLEFWQFFFAATRASRSVDLRRPWSTFCVSAQFRAALPAMRIA